MKQLNRKNTNRNQPMTIIN